MINKESLLLFLRKEGKVLNGHRSINTFMIFLIFLISLLSISFAKAGLTYLEAKMEDPFIKWVDIKALQGQKGGMSLEKFLESDSLQCMYSFSNPKQNYTLSQYFCMRGSDKEPQLQGRSFDADGLLFSSKILEINKNRIVSIDSIANDSYGIVITLDALKELGYIESTKSYTIEQLPKYVDVSIPYKRSLCEEYLLGSGNEGYYSISIPVLAVVKDVPGVEYTYMFSEEYLNIFSDQRARDITSIRNNQILHLYGDSARVKSAIQLVKKNESFSYLPILDTILESNSWIKGDCDAYIQIDSIMGDTAQILMLNEIANLILNSDSTISRIYDFSSLRSYSGLVPLYSIEIENLKDVRRLQNALRTECGIRLDMRNIESQENFQKMETVGMILSFSIIILALLFVTVFIFFLLSTHFQSIQMNLGTFKAFGIENRMLLIIYLILMSGMSCISYFCAWLILAFGECILKIFNLGFDSGFPYIDAFSLPILFLFLLSILDAIAATMYIAYKKLNHTPGDLIYNRNNK